MSMTMTQKILADHAGLKEVKAGQLIEARLDTVSYTHLDVYKRQAFMTAMGNTALFIAVSVPVILVLSLLISVYIYENPHLAGCLKTSFLIPMAIPVTSVVLMWRFLFDDNGIINGVLNACGMDTVNWMNTGAAFWILVLSYVWKNLGYNIILWLAALSAIDPAIGEAARIDGCLLYTSRCV